MAYTDRRTPSALWCVLILCTLILTACNQGQIDDAVDDGAEERNDAIPAIPPVPDNDPPQQDLTVAVQLTQLHRMDGPITGAVDATGRLYIAQRGGTVHAITEQISAPVIDISADVSTQSERGLLGIAFSRDGKQLYVSYTNVSGDSILAAYELVDNDILPESRRVLLTVTQPFANHNGGDVKVGPDGFVYWALGDGGSRGDPLRAGQDRSTLLGSIVRIDPRGDEPYAIPADNPFVTTTGARAEIWAYGLRNPWRFSFDRDTGDMWVADVGQNSREEINRVSRGQSGRNFGWNLMEGTVPFAGNEPDNHHRPVFEYDTSRRRCAITGGFVYRGAAIPELTGAYIFSDSCEGEIRAISVDDDGNVVDEAKLGINGGVVVGFVEDAHGELYVLDLSGAVSRIDPQ
ncbi:MAG: PQQ-dependent sugar dehydrogenase [Nitriliruptoraceae bacterium]